MDVADAGRDRNRVRRPGHRGRHRGASRVGGPGRNVRASVLIKEIREEV